MKSNEQIAAHIIEMEHTALERWENGDPGGFLEISAEDVVYFDPYVARRVDGLEALTALYKPIWGKIHTDGHEWLNPRVQVCGEVAVLTFNHITHSGDTRTLWNCTEVYRSQGDEWKIIQTHWSYTGIGHHLKP